MSILGQELTEFRFFLNCNKWNTSGLVSSIFFVCRKTSRMFVICIQLYLYDPRRQILTGKSINVDSGSFPELQDLYWHFSVLVCRHDAWTVPELHLYSTRKLRTNCISLQLVELTLQLCVWIYDWLHTDPNRISLGKDNRRTINWLEVKNSCFTIRNVPIFE